MPPNSTPSPSDPATMVAYLWAIALAEAGEMPFQPECEQDLRARLLNSVQQVTSATFYQAAANTAALVREMKLQTNDGKLHEWTLPKALEKLCPIFPFC